MPRVRPEPRPGAVLRAALGVLRVRRLAVISLAVAIMVPVGALDRLFLRWSDDLQRHDEGALAIGVALLSSSIFMLGAVVYAGVVEHLVAEQRGHGPRPMLDVLRHVPYRSLLLADVLVAALTVLGLVLFVLPGVVMGTLTALVGALMGIESLGVWAAVRRSMALVRRRFGLVFLLVSVPIMLQAGVGGVLDGGASAHPALWVLGSVLFPLAMVVYVGLVTVTLAFELTGRTTPARGPEPGAPLAGAVDADVAAAQRP